jgi:GrpB-like predicted nucleotidyltransferase (UPF0157 family)
MHPTMGHPSEHARSLREALLEPIRLYAHDPRWLELFERERQRIESALPGRFVSIRHIGSTAVSGLIAKPIIDMILGLGDFRDIEQALKDLQSIGYTYDQNARAQSADRRWLLRHKDGRRTHHLHVVELGSRAWHDRVEFCERLKRDPALRARYQELKIVMLTQAGDDRESYTAAKEPFIRNALSTTAPSQRRLAGVDLHSENPLTPRTPSAHRS